MTVGINGKDAKGKKNYFSFFYNTKLMLSKQDSPGIAYGVAQEMLLAVEALRRDCRKWARIIMILTDKINRVLYISDMFVYAANHSCAAP